MTRSAVAPRTWVWLQLILGWLPVWALYTLMVSSANPIHGGTPAGHAVLSGLIAVGIAALLGLLVQRITERVPWPHPLRPGFLAVHLAAAAVYSALWATLKFGVEFAAEQIAGLLRTTLEEDRDIVTLGEERAFVERYLELERIRFGDRLRVSIRIAAEAESSLLPSFALQTLVENAVRHGAAPRVEPTEIVVEGRVHGKALTLTVHDTGDGIAPGWTTANGGTGLQRLRERLAALYGGNARLTLEMGATGGCTATLSIPQTLDDGEGRG